MSEFYGPGANRNQSAPTGGVDLEKKRELSFEEELMQGATPIDAQIVYEPDIPDGNSFNNGATEEAFYHNVRSGAYQQQEPGRGGFNAGYGGNDGGYGYSSQFGGGFTRSDPSQQQQGYAYAGMNGGAGGAATQTAYREPFPDVKVVPDNLCKNCGAKLGDEIRFCPVCGMDSLNPRPVYDQKQTYTNNAAAAAAAAGFANIPSGRRPGARNKWVTLGLTIGLGVIGVHCFYEGRIVKGLVYLFTGGLGGIGYIIDIVRAAIRCASTTDEYYYPLSGQ